jgi:phospholipase/carboxylesterase
MQLDESAILWSAPERERAGRPLLVLMHGLGSHEGDLFGMAPGLPLEPVIASVRAPLPEGAGWSWFPRTTPGNPEPTGVDEAAAAVLAWLDSIEFASVSLLGFSQGGAMALQLLRHAPQRFTAAVNLSGFLAPGELPGDAELAVRRPPVFWGRGAADPIIPDAAIARTEAWLPAHADATIRIYEGLGHSVSTQELGDLAAFLREHP